MKLKFYKITLIIGLSFIYLQTYSQIDSTRLLVNNRVKSMELFSREIKSNGKIEIKRKLISKVTYNTKGNPIIETHYNSLGKEEFRHEYFYSAEEIIDSVLYIKEKDTSVLKNIEIIIQIKLLTGGIPDYFPKYEFYENGLLKSETVILGNGKESLFEYVYESY